MKDAIRYEPLEAGRIPAVERLHRRVFSKEEQRRTIFASPLVGRYLSGLIEHPVYQRDHVFVGVWRGKTLVGYAHYRLLGVALHLNQLAVLPECRGMGIGRRLLVDWVRRAREMGAKRLSLDVSSANSVAFRMYSRLGLRTVATTFTYECRLSGENPATSGSIPIRLLDWEDALAWKSAYGISTIRMRVKNKIWEAGYIHDVLNVRAGFPAELVNVLRHLKPAARWLLLRSPAPIHQFPDFGRKWRLADAAIRMQAGLYSLRKI